MKKKLNILGRKVPVLAVMMALLVIGTASAALIVNYATLSGTYEVGETITVVGNNVSNENEILFNGDGKGNFTITNVGSPVNVTVNTTLLLEDVMVIDTEGITVTYNPGVPNIPDDTNGVYEDVFVMAFTEDTVVTVTLGTIPGVVAGNYTLEVDVNPYVAP